MYFLLLIILFAILAVLVRLMCACSVTGGAVHKNIYTKNKIQNIVENIISNEENFRDEIRRILREE
jgi:hypothetical protein